MTAPPHVFEVAAPGTTTHPASHCCDARRLEGSPHECAQIECASCHACVAASAVENAGLRRLEGASDPADMLAVAALTCASCGTAGTIVLGYGPEATIEDADVLLALDPPPVPDA